MKALSGKYSPKGTSRNLSHVSITLPPGSSATWPQLPVLPLLQFRLPKPIGVPAQSHGRGIDGAWRMLVVGLLPPDRPRGRRNLRGCPTAPHRRSGAVPGAQALPLSDKCSIASRMLVVPKRFSTASSIMSRLSGVTNHQINLSKLVRHKPILKPVLEPSCLC